MELQTWVVRLLRRVTALPQRTLLTLPLVALVAAAGIACEPAPPKAPPVPSRVAVSGDSILLQAGLYGGGYRGADYERKVDLGWQAVHVQGRITQDVASTTRSPAVLVLAFGNNEVVNGWEQADSNSWLSVTHTPHEDTCVVWVKPWTTVIGRRIHIERARATIDTLASRPNTVVVDWRPIAEQHLAADGVHLSETDADGNGMWDSAEAYLRLIFEGVERCGEMA
jgi:hypothetical protein